MGERISTEPELRLWVVFFRPTKLKVLRWLLHREFGHVSAAAWYPEQERWVYFDPDLNGALVEVFRSEEFDTRWGKLVREGTAALRVKARHKVRSLPPAAYCVGSIKALLGVRSLAWTPRGLYRALLAAGAEPLDLALTKSN